MQSYFRYNNNNNKVLQVTAKCLTSLCWNDNTALSCNNMSSPFSSFPFSSPWKVKENIFFSLFPEKNTFYLIWKCNTSQQQQLRFSLGESHCKKLNMLQLRKSTFTETVSNWFFFAVVVVMANVLFKENKPKTNIHRNKDKTFFIVDVYPSKN